MEKVQPKWLSYMNRHDKLVDKYFKDTDFINEDIYRVIKEQTLHNIFGICSYKTPDLVYFGEYNTYIGEVKGRFTYNNLLKAENQVFGYYRVLWDNGIDTVPFIILGCYKRVFLHGF